MNATRLVLLLAMALPWSALAAPPEPTTAPPVRVEAVQPTAVMLVNCARGDWPTLQQIARDVGVSVFDPPAHVRHRAIIDGLRACRRGATDVKLVFVAPRDEGRALALADSR